MAPSDSEKMALKRAVRILSYRAYSERELYEKLCQKGVSESGAAYAVEKLRELKILDDEAYARSVTQSFSARGFGLCRIRRELVKRGISNEIIGEIIIDTVDPEEQLCSLIKAKLRSDHPDRRELKRIADFLVRRGFSYEEINPALRRLSSDDGYCD